MVSDQISVIAFMKPDDLRGHPVYDDLKLVLPPIRNVSAKIIAPIIDGDGAGAPRASRSLWVLEVESSDVADVRVSGSNILNERVYSAKKSGKEYQQTKLRRHLRQKHAL